MQSSRMVAKALAEITHNIQKNNGEQPTLTDQKHAELVFAKFLRHIPRGMSSELFQYGWQSYLAGSSDTLPELCDVLLMEYDADANLLQKEDWSFLCDVVNEYATDMDMELVQYIMKYIVEYDALV